MNYGKNIKEMRERHGRTRAWLAGELGITYSMLCQAERGTKSITMQLAKEIADVFGENIQELYK